MQLNNQLEFITDNFILKLINNIERNFLAENSTECLMQFEGFYDVGSESESLFLDAHKHFIAIIISH